jgi:hypothetical protein
MKERIADLEREVSLLTNKMLILQNENSELKSSTQDNNSNQAVDLPQASAASAESSSSDNDNQDGEPDELTENDRKI